MTHVRILSSHGSLATSVGSHLEGAGFHAVHDARQVDRFALHVRDTLGADRRAELLQRLRPLTPPVDVVQDDALPEGVDAELHLGDAAGVGDLQVGIVTDHPPLTEALTHDLVESGFEVTRSDSHLVRQARLRYGGASAFARQAIRFLFARRGVELSEHREWGSHDKDVWIEARDPATLRATPRQRFKVEVLVDDEAAAEPFVADLTRLGFQVVVGVLESPSETRGHRFTVDFGPFTSLGTVDDVPLLRRRLSEALGALGVDELRHPIEETHDRRSLSARFALPIAAYRAGGVRPYGSDSAERFPVIVRTDSVELAAPLSEKLEALGFRGVELQPLGEVVPVPRLSAGSLRLAAPDLYDAVKAAVVEQVGALTASGTTEGAATPAAVMTVEERRLDDADERVTIVLPARSIADGSSARILEAGARRWHIVIHFERRTSVPKALIQDLRAAGFRRITTRPVPILSEVGVKYGGAPNVILDRVREVLARHSTEEFEFQNEWPEADRDIYIMLPDDFGSTAAPTAAPPEAPATPDLSQWLGGSVRVESKPFLERTAARRSLELRPSAQVLRVGDCQLPVREGPAHPHAPSLADFRHFCLDQQTGETLLHLAEAVAMREPCLLEGETSTAKTSTVLYLAAQLGQPVLRVNLHGQTDTGELVGRYVPDDRGGGGWRWQEGSVLRALREGYWLLLDEVNLAEPQILERFNSLLEREPSLVVTEHEGERVGQGDIHPDFRLFATMNPAEYAGRSALSPAWRDRFRGHRVVPTPGEREIHQFLHASVYGVMPDVTLGGARWTGARVEAPWAGLADAPGMERFLHALARFHVSLERSLGAADAPGRHRRDRYVVTRRSLLSVLDWMLAHGVTEASMRAALARYYLERLAAADRAHVVRLLDAAGIGPTSWCLQGSQDAASEPAEQRRSA